MTLLSTARALRSALLGAALGGALSLAAYAETAAIHLEDGTTLRGEVISLKGGNYQIKTQALGVLDIPQNQIKLVEFNPTATAATARPAPGQGAGNPAAAAQLADITSRLQNSPALLSDIQSLSNDPAIMSIVQDPEIQRLIAAGDYAALMANSKMRRLMGNAKIRKITGQLK